MSSPHPETRQILIEAAGMLFAEHGFDAVSTRMIAEKAGVNLGGIHYHFGGKEQLYVEAFRFAAGKTKPRRMIDLAEERPDLMQSPEGQAQIVWETVALTLKEFLAPTRHEWTTRMLTRELANHSSALPILVEEIFGPEIEGAVQFYHRIRPGASREEALVWINLLHAQSVFHTIARRPMEMLRGPCNEAVVEQIVRTTARALIQLADLPLPEALRR